MYTKKNHKSKYLNLSSMLDPLKKSLLSCMGFSFLLGLEDHPSDYYLAYFNIQSAKAP